MAESYTPTEAMAAAARRALEWRRSLPPSRRGMTPVGIRRATQIANRQPISLDTVKRMASFLARHKVDKKGQGFRPGQEGYPSKGKQGWDGWGGDPAVPWVRRIYRSEGLEVPRGLR